jgi:hypothetical protein
VAELIPRGARLPVQWQCSSLLAINPNISGLDYDAVVGELLQSSLSV